MVIAVLAATSLPIISEATTTRQKEKGVVVLGFQKQTWLGPTAARGWGECQSGAQSMAQVGARPLAHNS